MKLGYHRWLLSYLPVFFIVISILILIFFFSLSSYSKKQTVQANEVFAQHVQQAMDSSLQFTERMIINELLTDEMIRLFFDENQELTPYQDFEISRRIKNIAFLYPPIKSIFLYRLSDHTVLTSNSMVHLDQFGDRDFVKEAMSQSMPYSWTGARVYEEFQESEYKMNVISLPKKVPLASGSQGLLVVNVLVSSIDEIFSSLSESKISFLNLLDFKGNLMFGESHTTNKKLTVIKSPYTGWIIETGVKNKQAFNFFTILSDLWFIIGFFTVLSGAGWMIYAVRNNYKPIATIKERIQLYASQKNSLLGNKTTSDEFAFINTAIEDLMESSNSYEQKYTENLIFRRRWFFEELFKGERPIGIEEWKMEMNGLGMPDSFDKLAVAVLEIDQYTDFCANYSHGDQHLLKSAIINVVQEIVPNKSIHKWSEWVSHEKAGIIFSLTKECESKDLFEFCENVRVWIENHLKFTVSFGIGNSIDSIADVVKSYHEALGALQYKTTLGRNNTFSYLEIQLLPHGQMFLFLYDVRSIAQYYRLGEDEWKQQLKRLFLGLKGTISPRDDIVYLVNFVIYTFQKEMIGLPVELQELWERGALPRLNEMLHQFDLLEEIENQFFLILSETADQIKLLRDSRKSYQLIRQVKEYIELYYANPDLSLTHLNEEFFLNIKTLSRIFQEEFGEKFVDYLAKVRIEHAKELLREMPLQSIQEIALKVGYNHSSSFIRVFKKIGGMTPGEYREDFVN